MSKTRKDEPNAKQNRTRTVSGRRRNISVRAVRREQPDLRKLSRAIIDLAIAQDEAEAAKQIQQPGAQSSGDEVARD